MIKQLAESYRKRTGDYHGKISYSGPHPYGRRGDLPLWVYALGVAFVLLLVWVS